MTSFLQLLLLALTLNNLALLGVDRLRSLIRLITLQGVLLAGVLLALDHTLLVPAVLVIKGGTTRVLPVAVPASTTLDRVVEMVPDVIEKVEKYFDKKKAEEPC